jgi:serine phosphatase RsbU (regulator of sigma subunit)/anti-sigma regulatory factor (Ser/Thr protein kinase)
MRLAAVALAVALILAGVGALLLVRDYDDTLLRARMQVETDARAASVDATQLLAGRLDVVRALASDPQIASGDVDGVQAALAGLDARELGLTGGVAYFDRLGRARATTNGRAKTTNARTQSFHRIVLATQEPFVSEALDSRAFSGRSVVLAVPARDSDGRLTGVLAGALRLDRLAGTIGAIEHDADSRILLVDRAGLLIAAPGLTAPVDVSASPLVRAARASGRPTAQGSFERTTGLQGERDRLVGWAWNRAAGWTLLLERPSAVGPARWQLALGLGALVALLGLGGAGIVALGRRYDFLAREQRRARELAEVRQRRAERLGALSDRLTLAVDGAGVEQAALELGVEALGADSAVIVVRTAGDVVVRSSRARPDGARRLYRAGEQLPGVRSLEERRGIWVESLEQIEREYPGLREAAPDWRSAVALPLVVGGEVVASLVFGFRHERAFDAEERAFQLSLAGHCAQALERARLYEHEHAIAVELQQSLLPQSLPAPPGVTIETVYRPGNQELAVGGDWYDAVELPDGRLVLTVGDVVGHGLRAAAVMGQLRSAIATLAHVADGPAQLLQRLDSFAAHTEGADCATLVCAYLDPATGILRYASAGHPPPIVTDDSGMTCLWSGRSTPLAVGEEQVRTEETARLPAGATVVLYSDGLVERRGESIEVGIERLLRRVEELADEGPAEIANAVVADLLGEEGQADDVALLVVRLGRVTAPAFLLRIAPEPGELRHLRARLGAWLDGLGVSEEDASDLVLATHEAAANSVEHGYGNGTDGDVVVEAAHVDGEVRVSVRDRGSWTEGATSTDRGRGLLLIRSVSDDLVVEREPTGTTVSFRRSVTLADRST